MKALILTDSHSQFNLIFNIYENEKPDVVIFAGDNSKDGVELSYVKDSTPFFIVRGNCDFFDRRTGDMLEFELEGKKIFLTHGHLHSVKRNYSLIMAEGKKRNVDIVIFGHTHIPYYEKNSGIHLFNPGAAKVGKYGILKIVNGEICFEQKIY